MVCGLVRIRAVLTALVIGAVTVGPALAEEPVCAEFTKKAQRIERLGGPQAFSKTPARTQDDMVAKLKAHRDEIETVLGERGMGHMVDDIIAAASGPGVSVRKLERGEVFEWMLWRKRSGPAISGPLCFAARDSYDAFAFQVRDEGPEANCMRDVTTHHFVVPQVCVNLAYSGKTTAKEGEPCPPPPPETPPTPPPTSPPTPPPPTTTVAPPPPEPERATGKWTFRGFFAKMNTDDDTIFTSTVRPDGVSERTQLRFDGGDGLGAGLEYHLNERVGLEGSVHWIDLDSSFILDLNSDWERDTDGSSFLSFSFGPNFHLTPGKAVDFYIGPFVGWADIGSASYTALGERFERELDGDVFFGAQVGLDFAFGDGGWGLHLGGRYIDLSVETGPEDAELEIDITPLIWELGFFKRF